LSHREIPFIANNPAMVDAVHSTGMYADPTFNHLGHRYRRFDGFSNAGGIGSNGW
jgi:hypothetical protein